MQLAPEGSAEIVFARASNLIDSFTIRNLRRSNVTVIISVGLSLTEYDFLKSSFFDFSNSIAAALIILSFIFNPFLKIS